MHRPDMEDDEHRLRGSRREAEDSGKDTGKCDGVRLDVEGRTPEGQWPRRLRGNAQKDGLKRLANVTSRSMPARPPRCIVDSLHDTFHWRAVLYTMHGHTPDSLRRCIVILIEMDEYEPKRYSINSVCFSWTNCCSFRNGLQAFRIKCCIRRKKRTDTTTSGWSEKL